MIEEKSTEREMQEIMEEIRRSERALREAKKQIKAQSKGENSLKVSALILKSQLVRARIDLGVAERKTENILSVL